MKKLLYYFTIVLFLGMAACNPCKNVDCGNGTCDDGDCTCTAGYEKDAAGKCSIEERTKFLGNWVGVLNYSGPFTGSGSVTLNCTQAATVQQVIINNLFTCNTVSLPITATVGGNSIASMNTVSCDDGSGNVISITFSSVNCVVNGTVMNFSLNYSFTQAGVNLGSGAVTGTLNK